MKKFTILFMMLTLIISANLFAQTNQVESIAKEILKAYKNKDTELLKKNASGILKYTITDSYFEDEDIQENLKAVEKWDGKIKEIGYKMNKIAGKQIKIASVYFADVPSSDEIYKVLLSNYDNQGWVMFGEGIITEKKEDFEKLSKTLSSGGTTSKAKAGKNCSIEMANGDTYENVSFEKLTECFNKLDDDNFFIILNDKDDFLQASYSDKGYIVEYKEGGIQYSSKDILSKPITLELFKKYLNGQKDWNKDVKWK